MWGVGGGSERLSSSSVEKFLSHTVEKTRRKSFRVSFFPDIEKISVKTGGGIHDFTSKLFCLTVPKQSKFVEEPFCAVLQKISSNEKNYGSEERECKEFPSKFFCVTLPRNFVVERFSV